MENELPITAEDARRKDRLSVGVVVNIAASVLLKGIGLFTAPVVTRILDTTNYGQYSVYNTWCSILCIVLGLQTHSSLKNAKIRLRSRDEYQRYCANALMISAISCAVAMIAVSLLRQPLAALLKLPEGTVLMLVPNSFFIYCTSFATAYLLLDTKAVQNFLYCAFITLSSFGLSLLFVYTGSRTGGEPYLAFVEGHLAANALAGIVAFLYIIIRGRGRLERTDTVPCLKISLPVIVHGLSGLLIGQSDRIMLQQISGESIAGVYSFTYMFASVLSTVWSAINAIWVPFLFRYLDNKDYAEIERRMRNFDVLFFGISLGFLMVGKEVLQLLTTPMYWSQINILPLLAGAFLFTHMYGYLVNYEFYTARTKWIAVGTSMAALVNILLNFLFIPKYGALGAALATLASCAALYAFHAFIARKVIGGYPIPLVKDIKRIVALAVICALYYFLSEAWLLRWLIAAATGGYLLWRIIKKKAVL